MTRSRDRRRMDWAEIRGRVDRAARALAEAQTPSPERVRELLEERARQLARRPPPPPEGAALETMLFTVAGERYAIEARYVMEVFALRGLTLLPGAEPPVFALTGWRGALLTIIDVRRLLDLSAAALNDLGRVIVLGEDRAAFGMLVDVVDEMRVMPEAEIHRPTERGEGARAYVRGITTDAIQVLDGAALLRLNE